MGYETRLHIGRASNNILDGDGDKGMWLMKIAVINLGKTGIFPDTWIIETDKNLRKVWWYEDDGDTPRLQDSYGSYFYDIRAGRVLEHLKQSGLNYPNIRAAKALLADLIDSFGNEQLTCALEGY